MQSHKIDPGHVVKSRSDIAFEILEAAVLGELRNNKARLFHWVSKCEAQNHLFGGLSLIEYTALLGAFKNLEKNEISGDVWNLRIEELLKRSYQRITGYAIVGNSHLERLPKRVLKRFDREEVLFHQSLFNEKTSGLLSSIKVLVENYIPKKRDAVGLAVVGALCFTSFGLSLVAGLVAGYLFSSWIEFLFHRYVGHSTPNQRKVLNKMGTLGKNFAVFHVEHSVHHGSVSRNYVSQFGPADEHRQDYVEQREKNRLSVHQSILKRGGERLLKSVVDSNYGTGSSNEPKTYLFFLAIALIFVGGVVATLSTFEVSLPLTFYVAFLALSQLWIPSSTEYHAYLHMPVDVANKKAGWLMRRFFKTRISGFIARSHRVHHAKGGHINQNLNPGVDFLSGFQSIDTQTLFDLKNRKALY